MFFFNYGVVIAFGLLEADEAAIMQSVGVHVECKPYRSALAHFPLLAGTSALAQPHLCQAQVRGVPH